VADDGIGLAEETGFGQGGGFGFNLITALAGQMHGVVAVDRSAGTRVSLEIPG
jgi:two-component sensor histidine kinase